MTMKDEQIRAIFMAHGFTIKDGQTDLKPYVYEAARALLFASKHAAPAQSGEPAAWVRYRSDGGFEGPIMDTDARMCDTRRGFWTPLYADPQSSQPVEAGEPEWIAKLRKGLMLSKMTHNFTFSRDEVMALLAAPSAVALDGERAAFYRKALYQIAHWLDGGQEKIQKFALSVLDGEPATQAILPVGELDPLDALRYMACRESAIERGLFATPEEYDAMVDDSLRKKGKEVLTGRGNNYGKKVAKDGSLYRAASPQPQAQTERELTDEQIEALVVEHSEWTPQGMAIVDSHRRAFARALLTAAHHETRESGENS